MHGPARRAVLVTEVNEMLSDEQRQALTKWYSEPRVVDEAKKLLQKKDYLALEDYLHKTCLLPLGRHDQLPEYMRDDAGATLFPTNLDPRADQELWQAAIEVGWETMASHIGVTHDDIHRSIASEQERDWEAFIKSVEQRKKERGLS